MTKVTDTAAKCRAAFDEGHATVRARMVRIRALRTASIKNQGNWGYVGSMDHVNAELGNLLEFLGGDNK